MSLKVFIFIIGILLLLPLAPAIAEIPPSTAQQGNLSPAERLSLARQFVNKVSKSLAIAETKLNANNPEKITNKLPEGEEVLLRVELSPKVTLDSPMLGRMQNGEIALSFRDFVGILEFPIVLDEKAEIAEGWYIRQKKAFHLNMATKEVVTDNGTFKISQNVKNDQNDLYVPVSDLEQWFNFKLSPNTIILSLKLDSATPLPILERIARENYKFDKGKIGPPALPLLKEDPALINYPFVDVATRTTYDRDGDNGEASVGASSSIATTGDFLLGTLSTQTQLEKEEKLTNVRATYKRESLDSELLGPLKARRYEVGDVFPTSLPLKVLGSNGLGARVTNADPLRHSINPSTEIRGTSFPGWDVELYRDDQLVGYKSVADDGTYVFEDVDLYGADNNFRVVLYGPQGEVQEEGISIPVDGKRLSEMGSAYDVTVAAQNTQTYRKLSMDDEDKGAPAITALYEVPVGMQSALSLGFETGQESEERKYVAHGGFSTNLAGTLVNIDTAADEKGEASAQLVARREINKHQLRNEITVATDKFDVQKQKKADDGISFIGNEDQATDVFSERFNVNGPLPFDMGARPRYNLGLNYAKQSDDEDRIDYTAGISSNISRLSVNQQLLYSARSGSNEDEFNSLTTLSGSIGRNRLRLITDYELKPEKQLDRVTASLRRSIAKDMELDLGVQHNMDPRLTEGSAQINWRTGFVQISPGVTYNTDRDLTATLNTRFGLGRDPQRGTINSFDRGITMNGGVSAFVYLDKNGDSQFNGDDEPLSNVDLVAPQNGGHAQTDDKGYALFTSLTSMRPTDVFVDPESLEDPYWISGFQGVSIVPREGHVTSLQFPIHQSGEIDGSVYVKDAAGDSRPLRGVSLALYDHAGKKIKSVLSESDGFFLFEKIPPGKYKLTVDGSSFGNKMSRPLPQDITIGYEGTIIYDKKVYFADNSPDVPVVYIDNLASSNLSAEKVSGHNIVIDMGEYKSRVMMALAWFKAKTTMGSLSTNFELLDKPSESYPDIKTGKYALRLLPKSSRFDDIYKVCKEASAKGNICSIYMLPPESPSKLATISE